MPTRNSALGLVRNRRIACPRDSWWILYESPELGDLSQQLLAGNPTLAASLANYARAKALSDQARAGLFPSLGLNAGTLARP